MLSLRNNLHFGFGSQPLEPAKSAQFCSGAALTWWESVQIEPWAVLGVLDW